MAMAAMALKSIVDVIRSLGSGRVQIDTGSFSLHYRATTTVFLAFGSLLFTTSLVLSPLECQSVSEEAPVSFKVINAFCWSTSTFTLPPMVAKTTQGVTGVKGAAPDPDGGKGTVGIASASVTSSVSFGTGSSNIDNQRHHSYYPWVSFMLLLHGLLFYMPHWLWYLLEGKRLASIIQDTSNRIAEKEERQICLEKIAVYLRRNRGKHQIYFIMYLACEVLNLANVIGGFFLIDAYLGGGFLSYGPRALGFISTRDKNSPMEELFPKMAGCRITVPKQDGSTVTSDAVCVLSMNVLYEKVYLMLWFWMMGLAVVTGGSLIKRVVTMTSVDLRSSSLRRRAPLTDPSDLADLAEQLGLGDIFLLGLIAENIDSVAFQKLAAELTSTMTRPGIADAARHPKLPTDNVGVFKRPGSSVSPTK